MVLSIYTKSTFKKMLMQSLVDCYVCLEPTNERSPCECQAYVHRKCLRGMEKSFCTICKGSFTDRRCFICFKPNCTTTAGCNCTDLYAHRTCMSTYQDVEIGRCSRCDYPYGSINNRNLLLENNDSDSDTEDDENKKCYINCLCIWKQFF